MNSQPSLFDDGEHSRKTRLAAYLASLGKLSARCRRVAEYVASCGDRGATRDEILVATGILVQSLSSVVLKLIEIGKITETDAVRLTRNGKDAAVLVAVMPPA